jgi:hypothetical protein
MLSHRMYQRTTSLGHRVDMPSFRGYSDGRRVHVRHEGVVAVTVRWGGVEATCPPPPLPAAWRLNRRLRLRVVSQGSLRLG